MGALTVRELRKEDLSAVRDLGRRAFSLFHAFLMSATMSKEGLVAEDAPGSTIVGALTLKTTVVGDRKIGVFDWIAVDPHYQGRGIGKTLVEEGLAIFHCQGCDEVVTTDVDGYNSASWNFFHSRNVCYWPASSQIREFGLRWPRLLMTIPHIGVGTFILRLPQKCSRPDRGATSGLWTLFVVTLFMGFFLMPISRARDVLWESVALPDLLVPLEPAIVTLGAGIMIAYTGVRAAAHWTAARVLRLPLMFRFWDSGLMLATLLGVAFGTFSPGLGGSFYVRRAGFSYDKSRAAMGKIMLAGVVASLAAYLGFSLWAELVAPSTATTLGRYVGLSFGITDTLLYFAPFDPLPAGHLWRWHRGVAHRAPVFPRHLAPGAAHMTYG